MKDIVQKTERCFPTDIKFVTENYLSETPHYMFCKIRYRIASLLFITNISNQ